MTNGAGIDRVRKLRWKCRRGMKELDILLERFVSANESSLAAGAWPQFEELLALEDDQLWDCMRQSGADHETAFDSLVTAIRQVSNRNA